ncbi:MAG: hypothetical protein Q4D38_05085 [Planctomycetia bacterium]|nr:hypothetical protein [Planctomycetia bacterium]
MKPLLPFSQLCVDQNGTPLCPLVIGISGHRHLNPEKVADLREKVKDFFVCAQKAWQSNPNNARAPIFVLDGLAQGADLLVAEVVLDLIAQSSDEAPSPFKLVGVLPMPQRFYEEDFDAETLPGFRRILDSCSTVCEFPLTQENLHVDQNGGAIDRQAQYVELGDFLSRHSAILLALWDGFDYPLSPGGTGDVVRRTIVENGGCVFQIVAQNMKNPIPTLPSSSYFLRPLPLDQRHLRSTRWGESLWRSAATPRQIFSSIWTRRAARKVISFLEATKFHLSSFFALLYSVFRKGEGEAEREFDFCEFSCPDEYVFELLRICGEINSPGDISQSELVRRTNKKRAQFFDFDPPADPTPQTPTDFQTPTEPQTPQYAPQYQASPSFTGYGAMPGEGDPIILDSTNLYGHSVETPEGRRIEPAVAFVPPGVSNDPFGGTAPQRTPQGDFSPSASQVDAAIPISPPPPLPDSPPASEPISTPPPPLAQFSNDNDSAYFENLCSISSVWYEHYSTLHSQVLAWSFGAWSILFLFALAEYFLVLGRGFASFLQVVTLILLTGVIGFYCVDRLYLRWSRRRFLYKLLSEALPLCARTAELGFSPETPLRFEVPTPARESALRVVLQNLAGSVATEENIIVDEAEIKSRMSTRCMETFVRFANARFLTTAVACAKFWLLGASIWWFAIFITTFSSGESRLAGAKSLALALPALFLLWCFATQERLKARKEACAEIYHAAQEAFFELENVESAPDLNVAEVEKNWCQTAFSAIWRAYKSYNISR